MTSKPLKSPPTSPLPTPSLGSASLRTSYTIGRGETGVLTFEPYKSLLLPHWAFKTVPIAENSAKILWDIFLSYCERDDFVGADMTRKFIQMGMTRARRYANYKGGRKYDKGGGVREKAVEGKESAAQSEKMAASRVFEGYWRRCMADESYQALKGSWAAEKKAWVSNPESTRRRPPERDLSG